MFAGFMTAREVYLLHTATGGTLTEGGIRSALAKLPSDGTEPRVWRLEKVQKWLAEIRRKPDYEPRRERRIEVIASRIAGISRAQLAAKFGVSASVIHEDERLYFRVAPIRGRTVFLKRLSDPSRAVRYWVYDFGEVFPGIRADGSRFRAYTTVYQKPGWIDRWPVYSQVDADEIDKSDDPMAARMAHDEEKLKPSDVSLVDLRFADDEA